MFQWNHQKLTHFSTLILTVSWPHIDSYHYSGYKTTTNKRKTLRFQLVVKPNWCVHQYYRASANSYWMRICECPDFELKISSVNENIIDNNRMRNTNRINYSIIATGNGKSHNYTHHDNDSTIWIFFSYSLFVINKNFRLIVVNSITKRKICKWLE